MERTESQRKAEELFSAHMREKVIPDQFPDLNPQEASDLIQMQWTEMVAEEKKVWEGKAAAAGSPTKADASKSDTKAEGDTFKGTKRYFLPWEPQIPIYIHLPSHGVVCAQSLRNFGVSHCFSLIQLSCASMICEGDFAQLFPHVALTPPYL